MSPQRTDPIRVHIQPLVPPTRPTTIVHQNLIFLDPSPRITNFAYLQNLALAPLVDRVFDIHPLADPQAPSIIIERGDPMHPTNIFNRAHALTLLAQS